MFKNLGSNHVCNEPIFLVSTVIWLTQSVGSLVGESEPLITKLSNSSFTLSQTAERILQCDNARGLT